MLQVIQSSRGRHRGGSAQSAAQQPPPSLYCKTRLMSSWTMSDIYTHTYTQTHTHTHTYICTYTGTYTAMKHTTRPAPCSFSPFTAQSARAKLATNNTFTQTNSQTLALMHHTHINTQILYIYDPAQGSQYWPLSNLPITVLISVVGIPGARRLYKADSSTNRPSDTASPISSRRGFGSHSAFNYILRCFQENRLQVRLRSRYIGLLL